MKGLDDGTTASTQETARSAVDEQVAASTQNQALSALLFLYREVLHQELGPVDALRAKKPRRLPTVLTRDEVQRLLGQMSGTHLRGGEGRGWGDGVRSTLLAWRTNGQVQPRPSAAAPPC